MAEWCNVVRSVSESDGSIVTDSKWQQGLPRIASEPRGRVARRCDDIEGSVAESRRLSIEGELDAGQLPRGPTRDPVLT